MPRLSRSGASSIKTLSSAAETKRELGRNARNGPLVRHGPDQARTTSPGVLSSRAVRLEPDRNPTTRRARSAVSQEAEYQGICSAAIFAPRDHRTNHTRCRALTPPCLPAGDQQFCGPQSRHAGADALRRGALALEAAGHCHVSCALGAGRASKRAPSSPDGREHRQWQGPRSLSLAPSHSRSSTPRCPSRVNFQTLSRRTNARSPVSHACDGQIGREPRLPNVRRGVALRNPRQSAPLQEWCAPSPCAWRGRRPGLPRHRSRTRRRATSPPKMMRWPRWLYIVIHKTSWF